MASQCPNCGEKLKWYNLKADCPNCGISIPNFNWEARLEEDNIKAEAKFNALYKTLNMLKYSIFGTKLRIARIFLSLIPAIGFILPWAFMAGDNEALNFDLLGIFTKGVSTIQFVGILTKNLGGIFETVSAEGFGGPVTFMMLSLVFMLLCIVTLVIAFFLILIKFKKPRTKAMWIADIIAMIFAILGAVMPVVAGTKIGADPVTVGTLGFENAKAGVLWGSFVFMALIVVAFVANLLVSKAAVKSEEELENERLQKVKLKEEKEEAERIKKEAAREEARKKAEEEQAERLRKAREALSKKDKK